MSVFVCVHAYVHVLPSDDVLARMFLWVFVCVYAYVHTQYMYFQNNT